MCRADLKYHGSTTSMLHHLRAKHYVAFQKGEPPHYSLKSVSVLLRISLGLF